MAKTTRTASRLEFKQLKWKVQELALHQKAQRQALLGVQAFLAQKDAGDPRHRIIDLHARTWRTEVHREMGDRPQATPTVSIVETGEVGSKRRVLHIATAPTAAESAALSNLVSAHNQAVKEIRQAINLGELR